MHVDVQFLQSGIVLMMRKRVGQEKELLFFASADCFNSDASPVLNHRGIAQANRYTHALRMAFIVVQQPVKGQSWRWVVAEVGRHTAE